MKWRWTAVSAFCGLMALGAAYAEHRHFKAVSDVSVGMTDPRTVVLTPSPIRKDWVLEGHPDTTSGEMAHTADGTTQFLVWRTTAGRFNWFYDFDESVTILDGEIFLTDGANAAPGNPAERRLGPGDVVFFHVGSVATWRVPDHVRKIATVKHPLPTPIASLARWLKAVRSLAKPGTALAAM